MKTTPTRGTCACPIKFRRDLNLPFASLSTLGVRIDAARRAGDPVTLAHAASELAVAEKVSGKVTTLTSSQLIEEAARTCPSPKARARAAGRPRGLEQE